MIRMKGFGIARGAAGSPANPWWKGARLAIIFIPLERFAWRRKFPAAAVSRVEPASAAIQRGNGGAAPRGAPRAARLIALVTLAAACGGAGDTSGLGEFPVRLIVTNKLIAPVEVSVDGAPVVGLKGGASSGITVSSSARLLTWTSAKPMAADGRLIDDDIGEVRIALASIASHLDIENVIGNEIYITARIFNNTELPASIGVSDGVYVSCGVPLPGGLNGVRGYTQTGYYRLLPVTEIRAYRDPTRCSGPYTAWPASQLRDFSPSSGLVFLTLNSPP